MEQLTLVEQGKIEWRDVPAPRHRRAGRGAGPAARGQPLRHRPAVRERAFCRRRGRSRSATSASARSSRRRRRGHERARRRPRDRAVPDLVRRAAGAAARGHTGSCESVPFLSAFGLPLQSNEWGGALSDLIRVPFADAMLVPAPASVPAWALAAAADNATDGWRCVAPHLAARPGATVLVVDRVAPSIALYAADAALALGAGRVDVLSPIPEVLAVAERIGAHADRVELRRQARAVPYHRRRLGRSRPGCALAIRSTDHEGVCVCPVYYFGDVDRRCRSAACTPRASTSMPGAATRATRSRRSRAAIAAGRLHPRHDRDAGASAGGRGGGDGRAGGEAGRRTGGGVADGATSWVRRRARASRGKHFRGSAPPGSSP